jgi:hypothetical protein
MERVPTGVATMADPPARPLLRVAPVIAGAATLAAGASAVVFAVLAEDEMDELQQRCDRAGVCDATRRAELWAASPIETYETSLNVSLVAAVAGAATTVALFVLAPSEAPPRSHVAPSLRATGSGVRVAVAF